MKTTQDRKWIGEEARRKWQREDSELEIAEFNAKQEWIKLRKERKRQEEEKETKRKL